MAVIGAIIRNIDARAAIAGGNDISSGDNAGDIAVAIHIDSTTLPVGIYCAARDNYAMNNFYSSACSIVGGGDSSSRNG